jgi:predicted enzyme related to lactoylglutathione lyase
VPDAIGRSASRVDVNGLQLQDGSMSDHDHDHDHGDGGIEDDGFSVHVSIDVPDLGAGLAFYGAVFGFSETSRPFPTMAILDGHNVTVCLHEKAAGTTPSVGATERRRYERHWTPVHLDLHVPDIDPVLERVRASGGVVENEFRQRGPRAVAFCADPFGNGFCIIGGQRR